MGGLDKDGYIGLPPGRAWREVDEKKLEEEAKKPQTQVAAATLKDGSVADY